jgi:hypothetical protein
MKDGVALAVANSRPTRRSTGSPMNPAPGELRVTLFQSAIINIQIFQSYLFVGISDNPDKT